MNAFPSLLAKKIKGLKTKSIPLWLMRQAGRYLPEYKALRTQAQSFMDFCLSPSLTVEATLQPLRRFDFDAAIIFSDILTIPFAFGQAVRFEENSGPRLAALESREELEKLRFDQKALEPVYEAVACVRERLDRSKALIGFCGGPWTTACYMLEGHGTEDFLKAKAALRFDTEFFSLLIERLEEANYEHALAQIKAGADVFQIFESHAGQLEGFAFEQAVIAPTRRFVKRIQEKHPGFPIIGFPRGAREEDYKAYFEKTGVTCCGLDAAVSLSFAQKELMPLGSVQGNLSPHLFLAGGVVMEEQAWRIMEALGDRLVFNLGHGVMKETPLENISTLIKVVRAFSEKG